MDTRIHSVTARPEDAERPHAQPFISVPLHRFGILIPRRPSDILFHYPQDSRHRCPDCLDCSRTLWGGLFGAPSLLVSTASAPIVLHYPTLGGRDRANRSTVRAFSRSLPSLTVL
jgi:hypothetical protein